MTHSRLWIAALVAALVMAGQVSAAPLVFVDAGDPTCAGMGTNGVDCFSTIQDGVNNAGPAPAVVQVAAGTYSESVDLTLMGSAISGAAGDIEILGAGSATTFVTPPLGRSFWNSIAPYPGSVRIKGFDVSDGGPVGGLVSVSTDGGDSWGLANVGFAGARILRVDPSDPMVLYAGTVADGVFKSVDGGVTWAPSNGGLPAPLPEATALAIDPQVPTTLYLGSELDGERLFKSVDGGTTWLLMETGLDSGRVNSIAVDPTNSLRVFAGLGNFDGSPRGIFLSVDGGASWSEVDPDEARVVAVAPSLPTTVYSAGEGLQKSIDGGTTWLPANGDLPNPFIPFDAISIDPIDPDHVIVGRSGCCQERGYETTNGGTTWTDLLLPTTPDDVVRALFFDAADSMVIFASTLAGGVLKSVDGGASWSPANDGLIRKKNLLLAQAASMPDTLYVIASGVGFDAVNLDDLSGDATIDDVVAHDATWDGVDVQARGMVTIRDSVSRDNGNDGFEVIAGNGLSILNCAAEGNDGSADGSDGFEIDALAGSVTIIDSSSDRNGHDGFEVHPIGRSDPHFPLYAPRPLVGTIDSLTVIGARANDNGVAGTGDGFQLEGDESERDCARVGPIELRQVVAERNSQDGIEFEELFGDVLLVDVRVVANAADGVELDADGFVCSGAGVDVTVVGLYAEGNGKGGSFGSLGGSGDGLEIDTNGDITVRDSSSIDNGDFGKTATVGPGTPTRTPTSTFLPGTPSPTPVTPSRGSGDGFELDSLKVGGVVVCDGCRALRNHDDGIVIAADGAAFVRNSTSEENGEDAVDVDGDFSLLFSPTPTSTVTSTPDPNVPTNTPTVPAPTPTGSFTATPTTDVGFVDAIVVADSILAASGNDGVAFSSAGTTDVDRVCIADNGRNGVIGYRADGPVTIRDSDVLRNDKIGICLFETVSNGNTTMSTNIVGNTDGMSLNAPVTVDASGNWWGDATGPSGLNGGSGDSVVDGLNGGGIGTIAFAPFLLAEAETGGVCDPIPTPTATPTSNAPAGDGPQGEVEPGTTQICGDAAPDLADGCLQVCPPHSVLVSDCFGSGGTDDTGTFCIDLDRPLDAGEMVLLRDICNGVDRIVPAGTPTPTATSTATPTPTATATPTIAPAPAPALGSRGQLAASLALLGVAWLALFRRRLNMRNL